MIEQRQMPLMGAVKGGIDEVPTDYIRPCRTIQEAMWVGIRTSHLPAEAVGDALGYSKGHWSQILNCNASKRGKGFKGLHPGLYRNFAEVTGNWALYQFLEMERRGQLNHQRNDVEQRRAQLLAELAELESA